MTTTTDGAACAACPGVRQPTSDDTATRDARGLRFVREEKKGSCVGESPLRARSNARKKTRENSFQKQKRKTDAQCAHFALACTRWVGSKTAKRALRTEFSRDPRAGFGAAAMHAMVRSRVSSARCDIKRPPEVMRRRAGSSETVAHSIRAPAEA